MGSPRLLIGTALASAMLVCGGPALAQPASQPKPRQPAPGSQPSSQPAPAPKPLSAKDRAYTIYVKGVEHYVAGRYTEALDKYERALAIYEHPRIQLQLAKTLALGMGKPAKAYPYLQRVLASLARLQTDERLEAQRLRNSLLGQLGFVQLRCNLPGVEATLDGKSVACGTSLVVAVGKHQLVGKKPGYLPRTESVFVEPRKRATVMLKLMPLAAASRTVRYWSRWKPWAVVGGGLVLAVVAVPLQVASADNFDRFRAAVDAECGGQRCTPSSATLDIEDRAKLQNRAAISLWAVGGAAVAAGLVLTYINRERTELIERAEPPPAGVSLVPLLGRDARGVALSASF